MAETLSVNTCCAVFAPLVAVNVSVYGPPAAGEPASVAVPPAPGVKVTPPGRAPPVSEIVGVGDAVALIWNVLLGDVEKVVAFALVNTGRVLRVIVKVAEIGASVGTVVAPHDPSASTAIMETLFRLIA